MRDYRHSPKGFPPSPDDKHHADLHLWESEERSGEQGHVRREGVPKRDRGPARSPCRAVVSTS
jgi:hypothetical protein